MKAKNCACILLSILMLGFPFEHFRYRIFKPFSRFLLESFQNTASFSLEIPKFIEKNIHFYLSDVLIISAAALLLFSKQLKMRDFLADKKMRFLTFLFLLALLSILMSDCARYYYLYFSLFNLAMAFLAFHVTSQFFSGEKELIHRLLWGLLVVAAFECFVGIGQFAMQKSLGLRLFGEHKFHIDHAPVVSIPMPEKGRVLLGLFTSIPENRHSVLRVYGTFPHPNFFAGFLVLTLIVSHYCFVTARKKWQRPVALLLIPLQALTLILTFSRAGFLGYGLASVVWFGLAFFKKQDSLYPQKKFLTLLASFIGLSFLLAIGLFFPYLLIRGGFFNYNAAVQASDAGRIIAQNVSLEVMRERPLLGMGFNCFTFFPGDFLSTPTPSRDRPHNIYLLLASEVGLLGLAAFFLFLFSLLKPLFKRPITPLFQTLAAAFVGFLFIGLCDLYFLTDQVGKLMFFLTAGLLSAAGTLQEKTNPNALPESPASQST